MSHSDTDPETILCSVCEAKIERYALALTLVREFDAAIQCGESTCNAWQQLSTVMAEITAIDSQFSETRRLWRASGKRPGDALRLKMEQMTQLLQQLQQQTRAAEQKALGQIGTLLPEIAQSLLGQEMHRAYSGAMTTGNAQGTHSLRV